LELVQFLILYIKIKLTINDLPLYFETFITTNVVGEYQITDIDLTVYDIIAISNVKADYYATTDLELKWYTTTANTIYIKTNKNSQQIGLGITAIKKR